MGAQWPQQQLYKAFAVSNPILLLAAMSAVAPRCCSHNITHSHLHTHSTHDTRTTHTLRPPWSVPSACAAPHYYA